MAMDKELVRGLLDASMMDDLESVGTTSMLERQLDVAGLPWENPRWRW